MEKHNTAKDFLSALDRLENDALSSRDGYGYSSGDAEKIRRVLAENEQLRKERDELAKDILYIADHGRNLEIFDKAKRIIENGNA